MVNPHVFPSAVVGFREAARLHSLVAAVWLVSIVIFVPVQAVVQVTTGPARANLPAGGLGAGEDMVVFVEVMRPLVVPLAVTLGFGCLMFFAWWILWHAGTVRWWLETAETEVRLAGILGKGLAVWWRYARLALIALILQVIVMISFWIPLRADIEERLVLPLLVGASVLTVVATAFVWLAALRGGWLLGEPDRRSALAAWVRGLWAVLREPVRSVLPLFVWALPGLVLLVFPLLIDGPAPVFVMLVAWLGSGFCWVAFHMSYAPPKPAAKRPVSPLVPPGPFVTTRFPTLHDNR
jgi:hypothetical protein